MNSYSSRLRTIANLLDQGKYQEALKYSFSSPAGDGWGRDNICINFSNDLNDPVDFGDVVNNLRKADKQRAIDDLKREIERLENEN